MATQEQVFEPDTNDEVVSRVVEEQTRRVEVAQRWALQLCTAALCYVVTKDTIVPISFDTVIAGCGWLVVIIAESAIELKYLHANARELAIRWGVISLCILALLTNSMGSKRESKKEVSKEQTRSITATTVASPAATQVPTLIFTPIPSSTSYPTATLPPVYKEIQEHADNPADAAAITQVVEDHIQTEGQSKLILGIIIGAIGSKIFEEVLRKRRALDQSASH